MFTLSLVFISFSTPGFSLDGAALELHGRPVRALAAPVEGFRALHLGATEVATWTDRLGERFAVSLDGTKLDAFRVTKTALKMAKNNVDPDGKIGTNQADSVFIVQFVTTPLEAYLEVLSSLGARPLRYFPEQAYLVNMPASRQAEIAGLPFVRKVTPYLPAYRLNAQIIASLSEQSLPTRRYSLLLFDDDPAQKSSVSWRLRALGARIDDDGPDGHILEATLTPDQLIAAAQFDEVMYIGVWTPAETDLDIVRQFSGTNDLDTVTGFRGQGVRGQIRDTGVRQTHVAFAAHPLIIIINNADTNHGSSTTGILFGDGTGNAAGKGILPAAQGVFRAGLSTGAARYSETQTMINTYQCVFESNSTGSARTLTYDTESANMDDIIFKLDALICQSQSNAGNQMSRPQAWAKNIVSIGGIDHMNTLTRADDSWSGGSIGPASDGRLKPDLAHFYDWVLCTTDTSDTAYTSSFGGTSAATPITCGHFGLLFQMWANGVFGNTVAGSDVFSARCHAMTAKALMINTAQQWTFSGAGATLSRVKQGWGAAHVKQLYDARDKISIRDEVDVLQPFETRTHRFYVAAGEPAFRATMCYRDPMGNPAVQAQHRVNDLTLKVTAPNGDIYFGNNGLASGNWSTIGGAANTKDTVENVFVQNPQSGVWQVQVSGDEIVQDAYLADGPINASYALVASGVTEQLTTAFTVLRGATTSGTFADMATSNNTRYTARPGAVLVATDQPLQLQVDLATPLTPISELGIKVEANATASNIVEKVQALNVGTGLYDDLDVRTLGTVDGVANITVANPAAYIGAGGAIRLKLGFKASGPTLVFPWNVPIDHVRITIQP